MAMLVSGRVYTETLHFPKRLRIHIVNSQRFQQKDPTKFFFPVRVTHVLGGSKVEVESLGGCMDTVDSPKHNKGPFLKKGDNYVPTVRGFGGQPPNNDNKF